MATAYYPTIKWYYWDGDSWEDISGYVLTKAGVSGHWGMRSNKYTDRLASVGEMRMVLDNSVGKFDPDDADVLTGWALNTKVKLVVTHDGVGYTRFYGHVSEIKMSDPSQYEHTANVLVKDWMGYAYDKKINQLSIQTFKHGGQVVDSIVDAVAMTPLATAYSVGDYEFPAAFDSMTVTTTAATELNKVVLSENGYFYCKHDKVNGETLVFEAESTRNGLRTVSKIPTASAGYWKTEGGDYVLMEDGTSKVLLDSVVDADFDGVAAFYARTHGENVINKVTVTAYPKRIDTTEQTIYSLGTPLMLAPGETKTITAKYQNVTTKESCNAITELCSQPVATTDYLMNRNKAGTSTNLTANLTVSVTFYTAEASVTLTNGSVYTGYVTRLYLKGYGVYQDASIKATAEDSTSQSSYGVQEMNIEQQYQRDSVMGEGLASKIVALEKDPRTKLEKVTFYANKSDTAMRAFLALDIGDMVKITESDLNIDDCHYIQGIEFNITEGNLITFTWILGEVAPSEYNGGLTNVAVEFTAEDQVIDFENIASLSNPDELTILVSTYFNDLPIGHAWGNAVMAMVSKYYFWVDESVNNLYSGFTLKIQTVGESNMIDFNNYYDGNRIYGRTTTLPAVEAWSRIAVTMNKHYHEIRIFVDGVDTNCSNYMTYATGTNYYLDDSTLPVTIGAYYRYDADSYGFAPDAQIKNVSMYNRILSDEEISADAETNGCVINGAIANLLYIPTGDVAHYTDLEMTEADTVLDNNIRRVGTPKNSPTCRLIP